MFLPSTYLKTRPRGRVSVCGRGARGYTVVELVIVLVLMGILAASAMPRFFEASRFDAMGYASAVQGALRYAQKLALASRCDTRVAVTAAGYTLYQREILAPGFQADRDCPTGALTRAVSRPGGGTWSGSTPAGLAVGGLDVYFDAWGRPRDPGSGNLLATAQSLAIGSRSVTLEAGSGYVRGG